MARQGGTMTHTHLGFETLSQIAAHECTPNAEAITHLDHCPECRAALEECARTELLLRMAPLERTSSDFTMRVMREVARGPVAVRAKSPLPTRAFGIGIACAFAILSLIGLLLPLTPTDKGFSPVLHQWIESFASVVTSVSTSAPALALVVIAILLAADSVISRKRIWTI